MEREYHSDAEESDWEETLDPEGATKQEKGVI